MARFCQRSRSIARRHCCPEGEAARGPLVRQKVAEVLVDRAAHGVASLVVDAPRASNVALDLAILEELRNRALQDRVALSIDERSLDCHSGDERRRSNYEPEPEPRRQNLGQRADVDHRSVAVAARQGRTGLPS